jgi:hypothetical protein
MYILDVYTFVVDGWMGSLIPPNFPLAFYGELLSTSLSTSRNKMIYNNTIMSFSDWAGLILTSLSILTIIGVGGRWVIRHYLKDILHEVKPNSGQSIKDQVTRLEKDIEELKSQNVKGEEYHEKLDSKIDHLTEMFINYISRQK